MTKPEETNLVNNVQTQVKVSAVTSGISPEILGAISNPADPPLNLNGEINIIQPKADKTIVCWNCLSVLVVKDNWNVVECSECHKLNRVPHENVPGGDQKISLADSYNHFDVNIPYVFGIVVCPFCRTENRFRRDAEHVVCYKCHHSFNVNGQQNVGGGVNYNFPTHDVYRFSDLYPDIISYRGFYPQPLPVPVCNCAETEVMLQKILRTLKDRNDNEAPKRNVIPYPMYNPYMFMHSYPVYDEPPRRQYTPAPEIRYVPVSEPEPKDDGFKITIRKKKKGGLGSSVDVSSDNRVSRSAAFEKIFYSK